MPSWKLKEKVAQGKLLTSGINGVVAEILSQRGFSGEQQMSEFLVPSYTRDLHDPFLFSEMEKVLTRLSAAKEKQENVLIFGDYDADGVTSSTILKMALAELGLSPEVYIPDKEKEGYAMNPQAVQQFIARKINLILTVDCGISNFEEIAMAAENGIDVIVIDHHHIPPKIPPAYAIINPKMENCGYPFRDLAGVGTTFKVVDAIYRRFLPTKVEQVKWLLDLVAIGTIADCVPLVDENRVIAKYGLLVLSKTRNVGLREMYAVGRIAIDENNIPNTEKVSFQIAPRVNSAGRMDHASIAFNLFNETDRAKARVLALDLEAKNQERQKVTALIADEIKVMARQMFHEKKFIFSVSEHYPSGIIGLIAGKIADEFSRPTAIFQKKGDFSVGSFRSIPEVNIIETIEKCRDLVEKYGGHSQAAGVKIKNERLNEFLEKMSQLVSEVLEGREIVSEISVDLELPTKEINFSLTEALQQMEPFGDGNEEPIFLVRNLEIMDLKAIGKNGGKHLKLFLKPDDGSPKIFEAIGFRLAEVNNHLQKGDRVDVVFNLKEDNWNGNRKLQLNLIDIEKKS